MRLVCLERVLDRLSEEGREEKESSKLLGYVAHCSHMHEVRREREKNEIVLLMCVC